MRAKDSLIIKISEQSNRYGDRLLDFLQEYGLIGLADATKEQLEEYLKGKKND